MTFDLDRLLLHRNARLRAWKVLGVPIRAQWSRIENNEARLGWCCSVCGKEDHVDAFAFHLTETALLAGMLAEYEKHEIRAWGCTHLQPLLGEDPPDLQAVYEFE